MSCHSGAESVFALSQYNRIVMAKTSRVEVVDGRGKGGWELGKMMMGEGKVDSGVVF